VTFSNLLKLLEEAVGKARDFFEKSGTDGGISMAMANLKIRINSLDGLRGVAILLVVCFHYYTLLPRNNKTVSYGDYYADFFIFKNGYLGVMLFFCISGFVITQTLFNSSNAATFAIRRFARLWPAMLICSMATFFYAKIGPTSYTAGILDFVPSLTFIDPQVYNFLLRMNSINWIDGSYWSLFTEVRFYALVAILFYSRKVAFYERLVCVSIAIGLLFPISILFQWDLLRKSLSFLLIANYLPYFTFGTGCFYLHSQESKKAATLLIVSIVSITLYIAATSTNLYMASFDPAAMAIGTVVIFALMFGSIKLPALERLLSFKPLTLVGVASYSLYLLHDNIGEKIIIVIGNPFHLSQPVSGLYGLIPIVLFILLSQVLYRIYESPCNKLILVLSERLRVISSHQARLRRSSSNIELAPDQSEHLLSLKAPANPQHQNRAPGV
jgi:peptidoglycan/LPS O-acetylase OafA/YrhL